MNDRLHSAQNWFYPLTRKDDPIRIEKLSDAELLNIVLGNPSATKAVIEKCGSVGNLGNLGDTFALWGVDGFGRATVVKLEAIFEIAARIMEHNS